MKTSYIVVLIIAALIVTGLLDWYVFSTTEKRQPGMFPGKDADAAFIAEQWVVHKAPTYVFDGSDLTLLGSGSGALSGRSVWSVW